MSTGDVKLTVRSCGET